MGVGADLKIKDYLAKVCRSELVTRHSDVTLAQEKNQASIFIADQKRLREPPAGRLCLAGSAQFLTEMLVFALN